MNFLPQASGNRPRLACEVSPQGVVAARADTAASPLSAAARVSLAAGAVLPGLKPGNIVDRIAVTTAIRKALEEIGCRPNSRGSDLSLIIPDAAVRVLLLDFDALPTKLSEALPIVRFRLKKMLPFDADDAMLTYQVMSTSKQIVRVLAVAVPRDVLSEYETVAREAGFEPGAVIPSTLACVAAMDDAESAALLVNANPAGVTTAIVRSGILLLHRGVDMQPAALGTPANLQPALFENESHALPLIDADDSAGEWAAQEALPERGRSPYASEPAPVSDSPYSSPGLLGDLNAEIHHSLSTPPAMREFTDGAAHDRHLSPATKVAPPRLIRGAPADMSRDIAEAVNVAVAYFEDTLAQAPPRILAAGPLGAEVLQNILSLEGVAQTDGLRVRELVTPEALLSSAVTSSVPRGWLAGVTGALRG